MLVNHINYSDSKQSWVESRQKDFNYYDADAKILYIYIDMFLDKPKPPIIVHCNDGELTEKYYSRDDVEDEYEGDWSDWIAPWLPEAIKKMWRSK